MKFWKIDKRGNKINFWNTNLPTTFNAEWGTDSQIFSQTAHSSQLPASNSRHDIAKWKYNTYLDSRREVATSLRNNREASAQHGWNNAAATSGDAIGDVTIARRMSFDRGWGAFGTNQLEARAPAHAEATCVGKPEFSIRKIRWYWWIQLYGV